MNIPAAIRFPSIALADAIRLGEALYKNAGRTPVDTPVAVKAIGYASMSGAARTAMAALSSYGIISKVGGNYRISDEFLKFIRPVTERDRDLAIRSMALRPDLFRSIYANNRECNENVLASLLVHQGLVEESAKRAARIYKGNSDLAKLGEGQYSDPGDASTELESNPEMPSGETPQLRQPRERAPQSGPQAIPTQNVLAQYSIPLGRNEATLVFTGETLVPDDFDALAEYVLLFKRQFERRQKATTAAAPPETDVREG